MSQTIAPHLDPNYFANPQAPFYPTPSHASIPAPILPKVFLAESLGNLSSPSPILPDTSKASAAPTDEGRSRQNSRRTLGPIPHPDFSFDDGNITLQVGCMLFTVHQYFLVQHSPVFKDMFSLGPESTTEGTPENPIVLPQLEAIDFEKFLCVLYPRRFDELPLHTAEEWHSVLLVADRFEFVECGIRRRAITQLEKTASCIQKIVWGEKYRVGSLLLQGYKEVCGRVNSLIAAELVQLQPQTTELIMRMREERFASARCGRCTGAAPRVFEDRLERVLSATYKDCMGMA